MQKSPYHDLFSVINQQVTVITPNQRLAATLRAHYHLFQLNQQQTAWLTPDILPLSTWVERLWLQEALLAQEALPRLLNPAQEEALWVQIISPDVETARMMQSAWRLLKQWSRPTTAAASWVEAQTVAWAKQFQQYCIKHNVIDAATLPDKLCERFVKNDARHSQKIILVGFVECAPQVKELLKCFEHEFYEVMPPSSRDPKPVDGTIPFNNEEDELLCMARFAKAITKTHPESRIGCVIPQLEKKRARVMQIFNVICEETLVDVSAGIPLAEHPMVQVALLLLSLYEATLSFEQFQTLLRSPFLGGAESEFTKRAQCGREMQQKNLRMITLPCEWVEARCPQLGGYFKRFFGIMSSRSNTILSHQEWAEIFSTLLASIGWPGERSLNSEEYQLMSHWQMLLKTLTTLDQINARVSMKEAWQALQRLAEKQIFHPQTPKASIQVMGLLEAAGMPFDYLWVAGMNNQAWPPPPSPHPFIPKALQYQLQMPHTTFEREYHYCQQMMHQFSSLTEQCIFSYAENTSQQTLLGPSYLLKDIPPITLSHIPQDERLLPEIQCFQSQQLEQVIDQQAPACTEAMVTHGGVSILKDQALCPFKAFATWRLHAKPLEAIQPGLRATERGSLLHQVLALIWNRMQTQERLCDLTPDALCEVVDACIDEAMVANSVYLTLEKKRLRNLLLDWLAFEKTRPPFKVLQNEQAAQMTLGPLVFNIRIDRIDDIDQQKFIIDYKTGISSHVSHWFGERPEAPQLPIYAMLDPKNTVGIAFAQLAVGKSGFKGMSRDELEITGVKLHATWNQQLTEWQTTLTQLSHDFYQGIAMVDPKDITACQYCQLQPLCRIHEELL